MQLERRIPRLHRAEQIDVPLERRGRRLGLAAGYTVGVIGAVIAIIGVVSRSFPILLLGGFFVGFGNSSNQLSRYAAADMYPTKRRASAIGIVVWGSTIGAIIGPQLIEPSGDVALALGLPRLLPEVVGSAAYLAGWFLPVLLAVAATVLLDRRYARAGDGPRQASGSVGRLSITKQVFP